MRQKENGAVKVYALVAPLFGNGSDGVLILLLHPTAFVLNGLVGKLPHKGGNIRCLSYGRARPQLDGLGVASLLAALPPRALADGNNAQHLGQAQKGFVFQIGHGNLRSVFSTCITVFCGAVGKCCKRTPAMSDSVRLERMKPEIFS